MSREGLKAWREKTHRVRGWSMRAHAGANGLTGQQRTSIYPAPQVVPQEYMGAASAAYHVQSDGATGRTRWMCSRRPCRLGVIVLRRSDTPLRAGGALPAGRFLHPIGCGILPCKLRKLFPEKWHRLCANYALLRTWPSPAAARGCLSCIPQTLPRSVLELSGMS